MEALLIIVCVAVGAVFLFMAIAMGWFLSLAVGRFLYVAGPFLGGLAYGIYVWSSGNKSLGNVIVVVAFLGGIPWLIHLFQNYSCRCVIHQPLWFFRRQLDD